MGKGKGEGKKRLLTRAGFKIFTNAPDTIERYRYRWGQRRQAAFPLIRAVRWPGPPRINSDQTPAERSSFPQNIFGQQHHHGSDGHSHLFENLLKFCHQGRLEGKKLLNVSFQLRTVCGIDIQLSLSRFIQKRLILHGVHKGPS